MSNQAFDVVEERITELSDREGDLRQQIVDLWEEKGRPVGPSPENAWGDFPKANRWCNGQPVMSDAGQLLIELESVRARKNELMRCRRLVCPHPIDKLTRPMDEYGARLYEREEIRCTQCGAEASLSVS